MSKITFTLLTTLFWLLVIVLVSVDSLHARSHSAEPPPIAWGSGQAASGGHCSGR